MENTKAISGLKSMEQDHLHLRGEYWVTIATRYGVWGSSPLTWRILSFDSLYDFSVRIISTYVENTQLLPLFLRSFVGSSPLTWRIQYCTITAHPQGRIISTYVENTINLVTKVNQDKDHLHLRGEY